MPNTKSGKKALRQSLKKKARNLVRTKEMRGVIKEIKKLVEKKDTAGAKALLPKAFKAIDKAAKNNIIKKNTANRKKAQMAKLVK